MQYCYTTLGWFQVYTITPSHILSLPPHPAYLHPHTLTPSHSLHQIQWVGWMEGMPAFVVDPNTRFSDIIVPTIDTTRAHFMLELFITNSKPV